MIHYHGISRGGSFKDCLALSKGRHVLVSFADSGRLALASQVCQTFALDNGAFSTWKSGKAFDFEGFVAFAEEWSLHPSFDFCIIPDVIGGSEEENDRLLERWELKCESAPVWHFNESFSRLERLVKNYGRVCLGSSEQYDPPNSKKWWDRVNEAMRVACDGEGRPRAKLHGLRMLDPRVFTRLPLHSADSTNAERNGVLDKRFGMYAPPTRGQRSSVIADRIESVQSAPFFSDVFQEELALQLN